METQEYCRTQLAELSPDFYLASLLSAHDLWPLYAFAGDVARIRFTTAEPALALIRLKWWQDEIEKIFTGQAFSDAPILLGLAEMKDRLSMPLLEAHMQARAVEITGEQGEGVDGALAFIDQLYTPLFQLSAGALEDSADGAEAVALNYGIMEMLRRAKDKSFVDQNRDAFMQAYAHDLKPESLSLRALSGLSDIWFGHIAKGHLSRPPACLALRLWTRMLF